MSTFNDLINKNEVPVLVDFYADWCGPCKMMAPVLEQVAQTMSGRVKVIKVDVDRNQAVADQYQIRSIPTLMLFHKGQILWQQAGAMPAHQLVTQLNIYAPATQTA